MAFFEEIIFSLEQAKSCEEETHILELIKLYFNLDHVTYVCLDIPSPNKSSNIISSSTYSPEWQAHYLKNNYLDRDLAVRLAIDSLAPIDWTQIKSNDPIQTKIFGEASEFGINSTGLSYSVRGMMGEHVLITVNGKFSPAEWLTFKRENLAKLQLISNYLHTTMLGRYGIDKPIYKLSKREIQCLYWSSRGKTYEDVATIIGISPHTVKLYFTTARHKLNSLTLTQAVAKAISLGIIPPSL